MKSALLLFLGVFFPTLVADAQSIPEQLPAILAPSLIPGSVVTYQLQDFLLRRSPQPLVASSAQEWTEKSEAIRQHLLNDVVFHGWPKDWVSAPPKFEDLGVISSGKGYRLRKLRYEVVPGFYATALLYEPEKIEGRVPAVLDVMGHYFTQGKSMEFEQKLCINQALRGMIALNLEWLNMGELNRDENSHFLAPALDFVGANETGLFYLAMRRGLDYLAQDSRVDPERMAVTGLSGGGWQTIVLSSLDPRVKVAIPVAGYSSLAAKVSSQFFNPNAAGDPEQQASDFLVGQDYPTLTAMRAPRPTLLIFNAEDNCCFRAPIVRDDIFEAEKPFFALYGKQDQFEFYENTDVASHNYGLSNREQAYQFLTRSFGLQNLSSEVPVGGDLKTFSELAGGLPKDNLTILGLARQFGAEVKRTPIPSSPAEMKTWQQSEQAQLMSVVRYKSVNLRRVLPENNTHDNGVVSVSYRFEFSNGLSAAGVWIKALSSRDDAPMTIVLNDGGKKAAASEVWDHLPEIGDRLSRGEQVLALDLVFTGDASPNITDAFGTPGTSWSIVQMLDGIGERPLGLESAQLVALTQWAQNRWHAPSVRLEATGIRSQVAALVGAAISPGLFAELVTRGGMRSLKYVLDKPVDYREAPDLFCMDLYKDFDIDLLEATAAPTRVAETEFLEMAPRQ
jgi:dienelactone hydrolase